jgi:hypothetical protein
LREYDKRANRLKSATLQTADSLSANPTIRLKEDYQYDHAKKIGPRSSTEIFGDSNCLDFTH